MTHTTLNLPGMLNPDFACEVERYISQFDCCITVKKQPHTRVELYQWCADHLGVKYRDWFVHEGGTYDKTWAIHIRSPKRATMFRLRWIDIILDSVDIE